MKIGRRFFASQSCSTQPCRYCSNNVYLHEWLHCYMLNLSWSAFTVKGIWYSSGCWLLSLVQGASACPWDQCRQISLIPYVWCVQAQRFLWSQELDQSRYRLQTNWVFAVDTEYRLDLFVFWTVFYICEVHVVLEILQGLFVGNLGMSSRQFVLLELVVQGMLFGVFGFNRLESTSFLSWIALAIHPWKQRWVSIV